MTFKKTLLSRFWTGFILSSLGIGAWGCTLLLTNANKHADSLYSLDLPDKPEILEPEIEPVIPPPPPPPPTPPKAPPPSKTPPGGDESPPADSSSNASSHSGALEVKELIKRLIKEVNGSDWLNTIDKLGGVYSIVSSVGKLNKCLEEFKKQTEEGSEAGQN